MSPISPCAQVLRLHLEARASGQPLKPIDTALTLPHHAPLPSFDGLEDRSWLDAAAWKDKESASLLQKISASYARPEPDQLTGEQAVRKARSFRLLIHCRAWL